MAKRHLRMKKETHHFEEDNSNDEYDFSEENVEDKMNPFRVSLDLFHI